MDKNDIKISDTFFRVASKLSEFDENLKCTVEDENFVNTEMNIVKLIKEHEGIHVTGIAELLGVTKGAVSQVTNKLEKKGVIVKEKDENNLSRLILRLTPKGEQLYDVHEAFHAELNDLISDTLKNCSDENKVFLKSFLDAVETKILKIHIN
ncbi:MarR family transcriptional regulator [Lachnospiraceae bacterium NSJ-143]|nr:MarR family transcriptional regulator [Lachnospiraceae bacterium NSJ-143]